MGFLIRGFIIGFSIAAPVGQIGVLCIRRTLTEGRLYGLLTGLGAATADMCYGFVAAFGISFIADTLTTPFAQTIIHGLGGLFLCYLGIKTLTAKPANENVITSDTSRNRLGVYVSTFLLTLTNPTTILMFTGVFAALSIGAGTGYYVSAGVMVVGVFLGSISWWLILVFGLGLVRTKLSGEIMRIVNVISGIIIMGFGVNALLSV